ncbi:hypothetical protein T06_7668 [Trichinella sp. T6]|nr:hypothetical protein T06_7668 [Trichinella sp. T6]
MMIIPVRIIPAVNGKFKNVASSSVCGTSVEAKKFHCLTLNCNISISFHRLLNIRQGKKRLQEKKIKAKAPPIDKERTPRNSDWIERYRTEKTEVSFLGEGARFMSVCRCSLGSKRFLPIMRLR